MNGKYEWKAAAILPYDARGVCQYRYNRAMSKHNPAAVPAEFVATAVAAADAARPLLRKYFRAGLAIANKSDDSPVTKADAEVERLMKDFILRRHPQHAFLGEETGKVGGGDGDGDGGGGGGDGGGGDIEWQWVIDPIDGTKSFATGNPTFGTLIALLRDGVPVVGVIDHAALDERWIGVAGRATLHNAAECATSRVADIKSASLCSTTPDMFSGRTADQFNRLSDACRFRVFGGDCYCFGLLSSGFAEIVCEASLFAYDYLALVPVVEGAGGFISDWRGERLTLESGGEVLAAANAELHARALEILRGE